MTTHDWRLYLPVAAAAGLALVAAMQPLVDPRLLFLDPMIAGVVSGDCCRSWYGFMSTLGVLMWVATGAVALFAAMLLRRIDRGSGAWMPLLFAGLISLFFGIDDVYLVHENAAPKLGVPQIAVLLGYVFMAMAYMVLSWRRILAFNPVLFLLAGGLLAMSLAFDVFGIEGSVATIVWEDGAKFAGIAAWASYHLGFAARALRTAMSAPAQAGQPVARPFERASSASRVYRTS
ncbi:MAG: hypothetical protein JJ926_01860 [Roseitalea sp.]|uniref:hypothetical protein n=1 Tax=Oceaniradius stylonematis TaxID=2184161 RepID=UPI001B1F0D82|nr:hypothetical protein [Oceaniradius stylonematis]MBO6552476.1 hypothetical protein [Roseitalea sp.]MBO6950604.1 hypothetical protein [Rhizobiaceae bacterium]MBO6591409.1 hypothetical protein [Roseitalea sp.]MBO6599264.1 hypothetical protein [Roseitalea sp.]MBO6613378.1 hypothetical protein [Roseitalea sp.]